MSSRVIKAGSCILSESPFVYTLSSKYRTSRCDFCLSNPSKVYKCSGCCYVYYCNSSCQTMAWNDHKHECKKMKSYMTKEIPDGMRMMAKIIIKLQNGGYNQKSFYTKTDSRKFRDLMTHEKEIREDARMDYFETCIVPFITNFFDDLATITTKELLQIYGKMAVNCFNVLNGDMNSIGTGLYLAASILDHSCQPNAVATFEGRTLKIRTITDLPHLNWDSVFISYIDLMDDTETRRRNLKKNYYFFCGCGKCASHQQGEEDMYAALCPDCKGPYCVTKDTCLSGGDKCVLSAKFREVYKDVSEFSTTKLAEMSNTAYLDLAKICLKRQQEVLHPLNLLHVKTLDMAFESAITLGKFEEAAEFGRMLLPGFIKYHGHRNPLVGILLLKLGKLSSFLDRREEAEEHLRDAKRILSITHGETSRVYSEDLVSAFNQLAIG